jgi:hypothetical protein
MPAKEGAEEKPYRKDREVREGRQKKPYRKDRQGRKGKTNNFKKGRGDNAKGGTWRHSGADIS